MQEEERTRIAALYNALAQAKPDGQPVEGMLNMIVLVVRAIFEPRSPAVTDALFQGE